MDRLTYKYAPKSNRLVDMHDTADIQSRFTLNGQTPAQYYGGFKDKHTATDKYVYGDLNGNMTVDKNKDILSIEYNHLNLPFRITFSNDRRITYVYDAMGLKLEKLVVTPDNFGMPRLKETEYAGGIIYENGFLEMIPQPEGYIQPGVNGGYDYVYQCKDHLGNIRTSYSDINGNGSVNSSEILSEKHYYPFGVQHKGYNNVVSSSANTAAEKFGYGGKEFNDELGLDWYDITARNYDPSIGRWMNIDPLAEVTISLSTFHMANNNPIYYIDPDGLTPSSGNQITGYYDDGNGNLVFDPNINDQSDLDKLNLGKDAVYLGDDYYDSEDGTYYDKDGKPHYNQWHSNGFHGYSWWRAIGNISTDGKKTYLVGSGFIVSGGVNGGRSSNTKSKNPKDDIFIPNEIIESLTSQHGRLDGNPTNFAKHFKNFVTMYKKHKRFEKEINRLTRNDKPTMDSTNIKYKTFIKARVFYSSGGSTLRIDITDEDRDSTVSAGSAKSIKRTLDSIFKADRQRATDSINKNKR